MKSFKRFSFLMLAALLSFSFLAGPVCAAEKNPFEKQLQSLSPDQLTELQRRVADYKLKGRAQEMTMEQIRAEYVSFIEKTVAELASH